MLWQANYTPNDIQSRLEEGVMISKVALWARLSHAPKKKLQDEHCRFVDDCMALDPKLSITRLYRLFKEEYPQLPVSESTIKRVRKELGWVVKKTRYCALISDKNRLARLEWCKRMMTGDAGLEFDDVVWTDECTVQLESHRLVTFRKTGQTVQYRMRPKHPPKCTSGLGFLDMELLRWSYLVAL